MASQTQQPQRTNPAPAHRVLSLRALNRATLARQLLLRRTAMPAKDAVGHLVGLQTQNTRPPYFQLTARLDGFGPEEPSGLMASREAVRLVTPSSTPHTHTADDCLTRCPSCRSRRAACGGGAARSR